MAGITTETTIRVIRKLANKKLVKIQRGKISIQDLELLREYHLRQPPIAETPPTKFNIRLASIKARSLR